MRWAIYDAALYNSYVHLSDLLYIGHDSDYCTVAYCMQYYGYQYCTRYCMQLQAVWSSQFIMIMF